MSKYIYIYIYILIQLRMYMLHSYPITIETHDNHTKKTLKTSQNTALHEHTLSIYTYIYTKFQKEHWDQNSDVKVFRS